MSRTHPSWSFLLVELRTNFGVYLKGRVCRDERPVLKHVGLLVKRKKTHSLCKQKNHPYSFHVRIPIAIFKPKLRKYHQIAHPLLKPPEGSLHAQIALKCLNSLFYLSPKTLSYCRESCKYSQTSLIRTPKRRN